MVIIIRLTLDSTLLKLTCQHYATVCKEAYPRHLDNSSTILSSYISFHHHHRSVNDHPIILNVNEQMSGRVTMRFVKVLRERGPGWQLHSHLQNHMVQMITISNKNFMVSFIAVCDRGWGWGAKPTHRWSEPKSKWQNKVKRQSPNLAGGEVQRIGFYKSLLGARYLQTTWNVNWTNQNFAGPAVWAEACIGVPPSAASATSPPFKL